MALPEGPGQEASCLFSSAASEQEEGRRRPWLQTCFCLYLLLFSHQVMPISSAAPWTVAGWILCPWDFPGRNKGVGCHLLFQRLSQAQGSNLRLLNWQTGSLPLSHQGRSFCSYWAVFFHGGSEGSISRRSWPSVGAGQGRVFWLGAPSLHAQPSSEGLCGVRVRWSPQVSVSGSRMDWPVRVAGSCSCYFYRSN